MKHLAFILAFVTCSSSAISQTSLLSVSPIPPDAENRFCYYEGLAYTKNAYIILTDGTGTSLSATNNNQRLLRCAAGEDGSFSWVPESAVHLKK